ncbi:SAM-dependent methyltransferase [Chromohalobacter canadensis]|uniref:SAM-dependent methyltransferase n=1 Tax=Chromohalobacter canadensis TaxID=141389 RepID=UPI00240F46A5|nr:cyclopropane-fatty-acyl-phospholipid synthase family protein [Chromohalobacter canadensis]
MTTTRSATKTPASTLGARIARWLKPRLLRQLSTIEGGVLIIEEAGRTHRLGQGGPLTVRLQVHHDRVWRRIALGGSVAAGETYMDGDWHCDDLVALIRLLARNLEHVNERLEKGPARLAHSVLSTLQSLQRNTSGRARRHVAAHYDLGNDLFETFLDREHWLYSSAIFPRPEASLEDASTYKLELILDKLDVGPEHHLLEIGTGWGGLALYAARTRGCRVTTTTISEAQYAHTALRIREAGLEDRITLLKRDYRDLEGRYDRLVSVEMIEAVGHQYLDTYLATVDSLLDDDGLALIQAITIRDQRYEAAKREVDFIKRYIFPGGFLPSHQAMLESIARRTQLNVLILDEIGAHYARTLCEWRQRFESSLERVRSLGYDERFIRMWRYYLCYCEGGFRERTIGASQWLLAKPGSRRAPLTGAP